MPELSMEQLIKLFKLASLGKVVGGLIHNLNGPLQNLELDMELAGYSLKKAPANLDSDILKDIGSRLKRMEEEFDLVNSLIKASSIKAGKGEGLSSESANLNRHIEQELWFLKSNLYFKHNVSIKLKLQDNPILTCNLSENILTALDWFLLELVEELEKEEIKGLELKTSFDDATPEIIINTVDGRLSESFLNSLNQPMSRSGSLPDSGLHSGISMVMMIFNAEGVGLNSKGMKSGSQIKITLPIYK